LAGEGKLRVPEWSPPGHENKGKTLLGKGGKKRKKVWLTPPSKNLEKRPG